MTISSFVILFNKAVLFNSEFPYPIFLTTFHLTFSALATRISAHTTDLFKDRNLFLSRRVYFQRIVPVALFYSLSLVCSNKAYIYLSISFIQMLKATTPVFVFVISYILKAETFSLDTLLNIWIIVFGVFIASIGELNFNLPGVFFELCGLTFEAIRLVLMAKLLNPLKSQAADALDSVYNKRSRQNAPMDPLVCLYHFTPICAVVNLLLFLFSPERSELSLDAVNRVGFGLLFLNGLAAFVLNVSVVVLVGKTSSLVLTLCGILKDIILVLISSLIWRTAISRLQAIGFCISIIGLFGYRVGRSPLFILARAVDREGFKRYYSALSLKSRKRLIGAVSGLCFLCVYATYHFQGQSIIPVPVMI
ncbi:triose-phosphate transporter family-domain-containing protein [Dipodascopsis uninucleata]